MKRQNQKPLFASCVALSASIFAVAAFALPAHAGAPSGEVLSPTPDGLHVREGKILFELQLTNGDAAPNNHVRIFWDFNWDGVDINDPAGYDTCFPNPAGCGSPDPGYVIPGYATPVRYNTAPGYPFRFVVDNTVTVYYAAPGQQKYRLKLLNTDTNEFNTLTGTFIVDEELTLGGYLWLGATTLPDGIDPPGWGSVSCANQNTICGTAPHYNLLLKKSPAPAVVPTDARYGALFENSWFGVTRETPAAHWWNLAYNYRVPLRVTSSAVPGSTGNTVVLKTRTRTLVDQALMRADRNDLRIVYWDGTLNTEVDRDIFRPTTDFVSDEQEIRFKLMADLPVSPGAQYYMYFANPAAGAPPNNPRNVYEYFEDFSTNVFSGNIPGNPGGSTGLWRIGPPGVGETFCTGLYQVLGNRLVRRQYLGDGICNTWLRGPDDPNGDPNAYDFPVAEQDGTGFTYEGTFNLRVGDPPLTGGLFARDRNANDPAANHDYSVAFIDQPRFCKPNSGQVPDSRHNFYTFCGTDTDCIDSLTPNPLTCQAEAPNQIAYRRNIKCPVPPGIPGCETSGTGIFNQKVSTWDYPIATNTDYVVTWNEIRYNVNQQHVRVAVNGDLFQEFDDIGNEHPLRARPGITSYQPTTVPAGRPLAIEYDNLKVWTERGISVTVDGDLFNPLTFAKSENALGWFTFNRGVCTSGDPTLLGEYCRVNTECGPGPVPVPNCSNAASGGVPVAGDAEDWNSASTYGLNRVYAAPQGNCSVPTTTACSVNQDCPVGQTCDEKRYPGQVAGWGRFLTLRDYGNSLPVPIGPQPNWGWTRLRGGEAKRGVCVGGLDNDRPCSAAAECAAPGICDTTLANVYTDLATGGYQSCLDCSGSIDGNSSNGDPGNGKCNICRNIQMTGTQTEPIKAACSSCYDCNDSYTCTACEYCSRYGVSFNARQAQLVGYAWAGGDIAEGGLGWVEFGPESGAISALQAWLATRYGDIFVKGDIGITTQLPAPPGSFNATYIIQSNGTIAFTSRAGYVQPNYPQPLGLPTRGTQYINVLGRLDFKGMTTSSRYQRPNPPLWNNIVDANNVINGWNNKLLDGMVYHVKGDLTINNPITFFPGNANHSGAGTIIVDGDLTINAPVTYDTATPAGTIVNIPSVAWLVRGNMTVSAIVGTPKTDLNPGPNIVGAFLVVGCPSDGNYADGSGGNPCTTQDGEVRTGASSVLELIVNGLMMAKRFTFERTVPSTRGSEQIIYDGRLVANPPPGLQDLTAALPIIREVTP